MHRLGRLLSVLAVVLLTASSGLAQQAQPPVPLVPDTILWRPAGPGLESAVVDGTPSAEGQPFTMLMRIQDGAWIRPHTHNIAKRLLVMTGELRLGYGRVQDDGVAVSLKPGSFMVVPPEQPHFEGSRGVTIVAMYGVGPFRTTFIQ